MDPGTALAIAGLAYDVTKDLYDYYRAWKQCDQDVKELRVHLLWLNDAFNVCQGVVGKPGLSADGTRLVCKALGGCTDATSHLNNVLDEIKKEGSPQGVFERFKASKRRACYPFRRATVGEIADQVESCREELHFAVNLLHLDTSTEHYHKLQELDGKLVAIDTALKPLPVIRSDLVAIKDQTSSVKSNTEAIIDTQRSEKERATMNGMMDWFCLADYSQQQNDFYARRQKDTGIWFLKSPEFAAWRRGATRTLICPGQPGAGKTIMAATVIHELLQAGKITDVGIAYLFCNYKQRSQQVITHLLGALVRQLLRYVSHVPFSIMDMYAHHKSRETRPSQEELENALVSLVHDFTKVYIVIDALDECEMLARERLLSMLAERFSQGAVQVLVTTRLLPDILGALVGAKLEIRASDLDVAVYLKTRMAELPRCVQQSQQLQGNIVAAIVSVVDGMFLLAHLHMDSLKDKRTIKSVRLALERLPQGPAVDVYEKVYSDAMTRIWSRSEEDVTIAQEALSWIVRARRPLKAVELQHALAFDVDDMITELDEEDLLPVNEIVSLCAGLIMLDEQSGTARPIHFTAQKFLEHKWLQWIPDAETTIALKCIRYMSSDAFSSGPCSGDEELAQRLASHPLLGYATHHWGIHLSACAAQVAGPDYAHVQTLAFQVLRSTNLVLSAAQAMMVPTGCFRVNATGYLGNTKGPHLVGRFGIHSLVEPMVKAGFDVDCRDDKGRTPLSLAAEHGHHTLASSLVDTCLVNVDIKDEFGLTPFFWAVEGGNLAIAKLLLETGHVDANTRENGGRTPLFWAATHGYHAIAQLLLENGKVDVDSKDLWDRTPLSQAAERGDETIVKLLLGTGEVDVTSESTWGLTPLSSAAARGHKTIMKLLLGSGQIDNTLDDARGNIRFSW